MKFKSFIKKAAALATLLPAFAFAATSQFDPGYFTDFISKIKQILQSLLPLIIALTIVIFFYEIFKFVKSKKDGEAKAMEQARMGIIWSIVAIFIMLSFLGIVRILQDVTGTQNNGQGIDATDVPVVF